MRTELNAATALSIATGDSTSALTWVGKLTSAELTQRIYETSLEMLGNDGLAYAQGYELRRPSGISREPKDAAMHWYLRSRAASIEGGTSQIMRNILGERVLGLPSEPRVDKDRAWSATRRGDQP